MPTPHPCRVLITGGDSGIGYELACQFAQAGCHLLLVSENKTGLQQAQVKLRQGFPAVHVDIFTQDLCLPEGPQQVLDYTKSQGLAIDVLVNNAGVGSYGFYRDLDPLREQQMIQLNVVALEKMTRLFLPQVLTSTQGGIIQLASIAAFQPVPTMAVYAATKAFVLHFTKALCAELREQGYRLPVLAVCPSGTRTPFVERAGMQGNPLFSNFMAVEAKQVAARTYRAYRRNCSEVIIPAWLDWLAPIIRRLPRRLLIWQARRTLRQ
ncbi:MAG: SDR family oxidoreductase [Bacteroidetes bacterium]|nr:MAG: SDR family oxidoreductase [Bacteroidota bacterium]